VADTPGHEQYTRNMVTGASTADLAVILIDARQGVLTQTRRHSYIVQMLGLRHVVLAVNKMDLVGYDRAVFDQIVADYTAFAQRIGITGFTAIPISGLAGDNITAPSANMPWNDGPALLPHLETVELDTTADQRRAFRMPVQWVNRPNSEFRGFAGLIASGTLRPGDAVRILPGGAETAVARIVAMGGDRDRAVAGESVTLTLRDEVDCSRGQMIVAAHDPVEVADQFECTLVWMDDAALVPGRTYLLKIGAATVSANVAQPKYEINVNTQDHLAAKTLGLNAIGVANVTTDRDIPFAPYAESRDLGGFILIDRQTNRTVAAGMIHFALRRATNIHRQVLDISRAHHAAMKHQAPSVVWLTGLSGSGKSTIANILERKLARMNRHTFLLDGDNLRHGLNKDLGFTEADRVENIRRAGEVARLMTDAGLIVITAFISPFRSEREMVRRMMEPGEFIEVFVDTPLAVAEARDVKGLYAKARAGKLRNFTGIDSPYEAPTAPDIHIDTTRLTPEDAADMILARLIP
jgi:bifunctional enzyme CysN/CysC